MELERAEASLQRLIDSRSAERRVRDSILGGFGYPGKDEDLALIRRKRRERQEVRVGSKRTCEGWPTGARGEGGKL